MSEYWKTCLEQRWCLKTLKGPDFEQERGDITILSDALRNFGCQSGKMIFVIIEVKNQENKFCEEDLIEPNFNYTSRTHSRLLKLFELTVEEFFIYISFVIQDLQ